jgi:hypothetical protein
MITHLNELQKKGFAKQFSAASKLAKASKTRAQTMITGIPKNFVKEADLYLTSNTAPPMPRNFGTYARRGKQIYDISPEVIRKAQLEAEIVRKQKLAVLRNSFQNGVVFN